MIGFSTGEYQQVRGSLIVRKNVVVDDGRYNIDRHMARIGTYDSDISYGDVVDKGNLKFDQNCYGNSSGNPIRFCLYCVNDMLDRSKGVETDFPNWQLLGYDLNSWLRDAGLDLYYRPTAAACKGFGRLAP